MMMMIPMFGSLAVRRPPPMKSFADKLKNNVVDYSRQVESTATFTLNHWQLWKAPILWWWL